MKKDLPNVFANSNTKEFKNSQSFFVSSSNDLRGNDNYYDINISVEDKINRIFSSSDHVYKSEVIVKLENGEIEKTIIGKTNNALLSMDNQKILISAIKDIRKK